MSLKYMTLKNYFLSVGGMMMVMMDDRMSFSIDYLDDAISDNLYDMGEFLNTTADVSVL